MHVLFAETQRLAEELEQRVIDRTAELEREKANTENPVANSDRSLRQP